MAKSITVFLSRKFQKSRSEAYATNRFFVTDNMATINNRAIAMGNAHRSIGSVRKMGVQKLTDCPFSPAAVCVKIVRDELTEFIFFDIFAH